MSAFHNIPATAARNSVTEAVVGSEKRRAKRTVGFVASEWVITRRLFCRVLKVRFYLNLPERYPSFR